MPEFVPKKKGNHIIPSPNNCPKCGQQIHTEWSRAYIKPIFTFCHACGWTIYHDLPVKMVLPDSPENPQTQIPNTDPTD